MIRPFYFKALLFIVLGLPLYVAQRASAQQSFGGSPIAMGEGELRSTTSVRQLAPNFNPQDLMRSEEWGSSKHLKPYNIGKVVATEINFAEAAELVSQVNGVSVYRMRLEMQGSPVGLNLYYRDFYIPSGGRLYIYTPEGRQLLGAYTHDTHPEHGAFVTEPLAGNTMILDYEAPTGVELPSLQIEGVGYLYRAALQAHPFASVEDNSDPGYNRFCQININCREGADWQMQKNSSVAYIMVFQDGTQSMCSGNLVNNLAGDFKPYILTAAHCSGEEDGRKPTEGSFEGGFKIDQEKMDQWLFAFHYEKPRCSSGDYATTFSRTLSGAKVRSYLSVYGYSDGMLLELNQQVPLDYRVYYSGWDAHEVPSWKSGAGIHHPAGDATKISRYNSGMTLGQWESSSDGYSISCQGGKDDHYSLEFFEGNTEGGSSGSPLFNDKGLQVATLTGGMVRSCAMDGMYGRLSSHFDKYASKGDLYHMKKWLDPNNSGSRLVEGTWREGYVPLEVVRELRAQIDPAHVDHVLLSWDAVPAHPQGYSIRYNVYGNNELLDCIDGSTYTAAIPKNASQVGYVSYSVEAVYDINGKAQTTAPAFRSVYTGELVRQVDSQVNSEPTGGVKVSWNAPVNAQIVTKILDPNKMSIVKAKGTDAKKYGSYGIKEAYIYDVFRLGRSPLETKMYVHQMNILPAFDTPVTSAGTPDYKKAAKIFLRQKNNRSVPASKSVIVPEGTTLKKEWYPVQLSTPFEIDSEYLLEAGFVIPTSDPYYVNLDRNAKDDHINTDGGKMALFVRSSWEQKFVNISTDNFSEGYMAIELVISDNPRRQTKPIEKVFCRGPLPVDFPRVVEYVIYRNDQQVGKVDASTYSFVDAQGKSTDTYRIEVRYGEVKGVGVESVLTSEQPYLYPAEIEQQATIAGSEQVELLKIYDMAGRVVYSLRGDALHGVVDLGHLAPGSYIVSLQTPTQFYTQKVTKL